MKLAIHPELENKIRARAQAEGLTVEAYLEQLFTADQQAAAELELLALEGLRSGQPVEPGPQYWQEKHQRLDEHLKKT